MNKLTALILMLCLGCQCVLKLSIMAWFEINQDYIAATLCENRARPELVCCGKCVLTKQLKKAGDSEQQNSKNAPAKQDRSSTVVFILPEQFAGPKANNIINRSIQNAVLPDHFDTDHPVSIFHPPTFIFA